MYTSANVFPYVVMDVSSSLPDPDTFVNQAYNMAWPQILAFSSAIIGIIVVPLIINALTKGS